MTVSGTYLEAIVADVRARLADGVEAQVAATLAEREPRATRSLRASIERSVASGELAVIAEMKRRSPSVGAIDADADPVRRAAGYAHAGAAAISVLTEPEHFGGSLSDLRAVRSSCGDTPVLRKDFLLETVQLEAALASGADAALLIAAVHDAATLSRLVDDAHGLGLEVLLEVHDETDLERALATSASMIGINNRDLRSFEVDLATTERLAPLVPADRLVIAESGVRSEADAARMRRAGAHALLVGESLMRAPADGPLLRTFAAAGTVTDHGR